MYVIVGGAGEVGFHVARALRDEGHDVAVIESNPERLERIQELDVLAIQGNVANRKILENDANIQDAKLLIACTGSDEINMVACALAKTYGCKTIARINETEYLDVAYSTQYKAMGIDMAVSPEMVAATRIRRLLDQPELTNAEIFLNGKVMVAEGRVTSTSPVAGRRLSDIEPPEGFNLFALYRGDEVIIPSKHTTLHPNDRLLMVVTSAEVLKEVGNYLGKAKQITRGSEPVKRVMIDGATRVGIHLAALMVKHKKDVVLIERDPELCRIAGEQLEKALVVHGDANDRSLLIQENVDTFDAFVAATREEEHNVLAALMAKQLGVKTTVAIIHQPELKTFLESLDIDLAVAPRLSTVGAILKHVHPVAEDLELQHMGDERVMTFKVTVDAAVAGRTIRKVHWPKHSILAAIVRNGEVILPRGDDTLEVGDSVLAYCLAGSVVALERQFK
jgi:trk system potassium uptake protein TrkA